LIAKQAQRLMLIIPGHPVLQNILPKNASDAVDAMGMQNLMPTISEVWVIAWLFSSLDSSHPIL
jgi:hypothetical protein